MRVGMRTTAPFIPYKKERGLMSDKRRTRVFEYPNMIVTVHFANISNEENKRRMARLHDAAAELLKEVIK